MRPGCRARAMKPREFARPGRGSLNARPCTCNELARIVRATFQAFPARPRRGKRGPEDQEQERFPRCAGKRKLLLFAFRSCLSLLIFLPLHRTEHRRRRRGKGAYVRAQGCASSRRPAGAEKRRAPRALRARGAVSGAASLTPGILPFAASRPASPFAPLLRRSAYFSSLLKKSKPLAEGEWKLFLEHRAESNRHEAARDEAARPAASASAGSRATVARSKCSPSVSCRVRARGASARARARRRPGPRPQAGTGSSGRRLPPSRRARAP